MPIRDPRRALAAPLLLAALSGCRPAPAQGEPTPVLLVLPEGADEATERTGAAVGGYLERLVGAPPQVVRMEGTGLDAIVDASARAGAALTLVLAADALVPERFDAARLSGLGDDGFALDVADEGDHKDMFGETGTTVVLAGAGSRLARQFAAYEALRRLGVRFYHPEDEYVPQLPEAQLRARARTPTALHRDGADYVADFYWRTWSFHLPHPLEHLEAFSDGDFPIDEAVRVNDWIVKNRGNRFRGPGRGVAGEEAYERRAAELSALRDLLGFPRGAGIRLHDIQQGGRPDIDPDSAVPVRRQIEDMVARGLADAPDARYFGIHFGPTELTVTPDQETVQWLDWAGQAALALRPDLEVEINNHITGSQPSPNYDDLGCPNGTNDDGRIDYYDLAFHTDPRLGVTVHTVMFYPLEGPAEVYGQRSFSHKLCLIERAQAEGRTINYFPEGSWWLSFDNPIPVYLPLYVWTRWRDADLLRPFLPRSGGTLRGYRMFNSGQEWGYWQQDYAAGLFAWNADVTPEQALGELLDPLCAPDVWPASCPARDEAAAVLEELIDHQRALFLEAPDWEGKPGGLFAYFAGEDDADVIAGITGIAFRPVRVAFDKLLGWSEGDIAHLRATDLAALQDSADRHAEWLARLEALAPGVPEAGAPWLAEIVDGVAINELRARQTIHLYESVLAYREAKLAGGDDVAAAAAGEPGWQAAQDVLVRAEAVIRRREAAYRYPHAQVNGGGLSPETAVPNGTTYGYRVHHKTHVLYYWKNRADQVRALLDGGASGPRSALDIREAIAAPGVAVALAWDAAVDAESAVQIGDLGVVDPTFTAFDLGGAAGYFAVSGNLVVDGAALPVAGGLVRATRQADSEAGGITVTTPTDPTAQSMIEGVFPAIRWAFVDAGPAAPALALATDPEEDGSVGFDELKLAPVALDGAAFTAEPVDLAVPVATSAAGQPIVVRLTDAALSGSVDAAGFTGPIHLEADMSVPDFVVALKELGGFDEAGALELLATLLGIDPAAPPPTVPVVADIALAP